MTQPWYPFWWADYSGKTHHLTMAQNGAYMLLLRKIYTDGKPLDPKQCYSIAKALTPQDRADVELILDEYFVKTACGYVNEKANDVMAAADKLHKKRVKAGKKGGKSKSSNAKAKLEPNSTTHTHNHNHINTPLTSPSSPHRSSYSVGEGGVLMKDEGKKKPELKPETIAKAKGLLPRADIYSLATEYFETKYRSGETRSADAAFLGWIKRYSEHHPELRAA